MSEREESWSLEGVGLFTTPGLCHHSVKSAIRSMLWEMGCEWTYTDKENLTLKSNLQPAVPISR